MMISFAGLSPDVAEAMCTPMHLILSPASSPAPSTVCPPPGSLYLGSISAVLDPSVLQAHQIASLVQVLDVPWLPASDGLDCYRIDILDLESEDLTPHLEHVVDHIDAALKHGKNVLVHCQQGISRSAAIVIAYLIRKRGMSYDGALAFVRQRRPCIKPNAGFVRSLKDYERVWRAKPSASASSAAASAAASTATAASAPRPRSYHQATRVPVH